MKLEPVFTDIGTNYRKYGPNPHTQDYLKFFAVIIMVIDHTGHYFFPDQLWWRAVGRIGFPIWFFLAGYAKPSRPGDQLLFLAAGLLAFDILLHRDIFPINALLSIYACRWFTSSKIANQEDGLTFFNLLLALIILLIVALPSQILFEYGSLGLLFALCGHYERMHKGHPLTFVANFIAFAVFFYIEIIAFKFDLPQKIVMMIGTFLVFGFLTRMKPRVYKLSSTQQIAVRPVNFIGRNTQYVYFAHLALFKVLHNALK